MCALFFGLIINNGGNQMTDTFTKGPWKVEASSLNKSGVPHSYYIIDSSDEWNAVASTFANANLPNARLIAAAPDLLEALETLVNLDDNYGPFGGEMYQDMIESVWDKARAAIAKARGQS